MISSDWPTVTLPRGKMRIEVYRTVPRTGWRGVAQRVEWALRWRFKRF